MKDKEGLIRVVKTKDQQVFIDETGKADGRGAYVCKNVSCFEKSFKSKGFERSFKGKINPDIYDALKHKIYDIGGG